MGGGDRPAATGPARRTGRGHGLERAGPRRDAGRAPCGGAGRVSACDRAAPARRSRLSRRGPRRRSRITSWTRRSSTPKGPSRLRERTRRRAVESHALLAAVALARHDADAARSEAALVKQSDPASVWPFYVDARLLYDEGYYAEALPLFLRAITELRTSRADPMPDLHYSTGDVLLQAGEYQRAEVAAPRGAAPFSAQRAGERGAGVAVSVHRAARERRSSGVGSDSRHAHSRFIHAGGAVVDIAWRSEAGRPDQRRRPTAVRPLEGSESTPNLALEPFRILGHVDRNRAWAGGR